MGLLNKLWKGITGKDTIDHIFAKIPDAAPEKLDPDTCYIEMYVESLRLEKARRWATTFHGVVYSFATLARQGYANAELAAITKPDKLANLDKDSLGNVITVHKQVMGAVAWRGGTLGLELGLFSAKSGNLMTPVIDFVTRVSSTAGISFVGAVKPFLPLITEGMDMIAGQKDETNLEVGLDTNLALTETGAYAIIDAPKETIDLTKLTLDRDGRLLLNLQPLKHAYCVFSIRRQTRKADFGEIPELKEKFAALDAAIRKGVEKDARDALTALRLETIVTPDLITEDARRLVKLATDKVAEAFPAGGVSASLSDRPPETLADLMLYE